MLYLLHQFPMETNENLTHKALDAFWEVVVCEYPETKSGDLSPSRSMALWTAAEEAIEEWISNNVQHCTSCGSEIVETINDSNFHDGECGSCEYERYKSQSDFRDALDFLLQQTVDMDLAHGIELTKGERQARARALKVFPKSASKGERK